MKPLRLVLAAGGAAAVVCCGCGRAPSARQTRPVGLELRTADDLHGRRIGVIVGSAHDTYATKSYPDAEIVQFQTAADLVLSVVTGKVDAGISDAEPLAEVMRVNPSLAALGEPLFSAAVGAGFRKDEGELRASFDRFLGELRRDGVYDDMVERWFRRRDTRMPAIAEAGGGELVVGTSIGSLPFGALQDGEMVGFDIELAKRFAASANRRLVLTDMPFGGLIAALAAGKIDAIVANMFITPERQERIDFSEPYFLTDARAYVLKHNLAGGGGEPAGAEASPAGRASFLDRAASSFRSNILREKRYLLIRDGLVTTVEISLLATLFGTALGALVCFLRMSRARVLQGIGRAYIALLRGTPVLVLLMIIFYVVFASVNLSPVLVAVVAFGMNFAAYAAEIYRSGIESVDKGQSEAGIAMGFTPFGAFRHIVLPQTVQRILPVYKGEVISLVKMTSIVGYIAVQDLTKASDIIRSRTFDPFFPLLAAALLYFLIAGALIKGLELIERGTDPKARRARAAAR